MKVFQQHCVVVLIVLTLSSELFVVDVECRRAIQPVEDVGDIVKRLNNINLNVIDNEGNYILFQLFKVNVFQFHSFIRYWYL